MEDQAEYKVRKNEPKPNKLIRAGILFIGALMLAVLIAAFILMFWNIYNAVSNG